MNIPRQTPQKRLMKIVFFLPFYIYIFMWHATPLWSQEASTAEFLLISPDAHVAAMGNSGVTQIHSPFAIYHNPALLSQNKNRFQMSAGQMEWLLDTKAQHAAASYAWRDKQGRPYAMGVMASYWSTSAFDATDVLGNIVGKVDYSAQSVGLSLSHAPVARVHIGATIKSFEQSLGEESFVGPTQSAKGKSWAADLGLSYLNKKMGMIFGAAIRNIGPKAKVENHKESLPTEISVGIQKNLGDQRVHASLEAVQKKGETFSFKSGLGFNPMPSVTLRAGYDTLLSRENYVGLTTGLGMSFDHWSLDYSYSPFGELGETQRVTLSWRFGKQKEERIKQRKRHPWSQYQKKRYRPGRHKAW